MNGGDRAQPEAGLTERIRAGDHEAFAALFHALYPSLCSLVARRIGSDAIAEELVQDVFLRVWERRLMLDPERSLTSYLYRAARNQVADHLKHRRIATRSQDMVVVSLETSRDETEEDVRYDEMMVAAQSAIDQLPTRCREIFLLSRKASLSYGDIARLLGISIKSVETQMGRALKALRTRLAPFIGP